jgi:hypothetical protein
MPVLTPYCVFEACTKTRNNRNETTGTKPPEQPERPEQESEMTGTTEITIVPVVFYYIVPIVFDFGFGGSGHF